MIWNQHKNIEGLHAILGASKYHWLNYDDDKMTDIFYSINAAQRGTELHAFAASAIRLGQRLPKSKKTLNSYVNDAIGFGMKPEQPLFYSENCFGTADAIAFNDGFLRIHDLKTGTTTANIKQLYIYSALFCLEYHIKPKDINSELRIYQMDDVYKETPNASDIKQVMDKIVHFDKLLKSLKEMEE